MFTFLDKLIGVPGASIRIFIILLCVGGLFLFAGYVLVPHPDFLEYWVPSLMEDIDELTSKKGEV